MTPQLDEAPRGDELTDWYEEIPPSEAQGSTQGPMPTAKATPRGRERSPRNLRRRQVARSVKAEPRINWDLRVQPREFQTTMSVDQMKMEWALQETEEIQLNLDRQHEIIEKYPKWRTKWSLLMDPGSWSVRGVDSHDSKR